MQGPQFSNSYKTAKIYLISSVAVNMISSSYYIHGSVRWWNKSYFVPMTEPIVLAPKVFSMHGNVSVELLSLKIGSVAWPECLNDQAKMTGPVILAWSFKHSGQATEPILRLNSSTDTFPCMENTFGAKTMGSVIWMKYALQDSHKSSPLFHLVSGVPTWKESRFYGGWIFSLPIIFAVFTAMQH